LTLFSKEYQLMMLAKFRAKIYKNQSLTTDSSHYKSEATQTRKDLEVISTKNERIKSDLKDEQLGSFATINSSE
jgi:hypothetical protein